MMMLTGKDKANLPKIRATESDKDPMVWVKFFRGAWTWFVTEFDGRDEMFGYVYGPYDGELGYISLSELARNRVERDRFFKPKLLSQAKAEYKRDHGYDESARPVAMSGILESLEGRTIEEAFHGGSIMGVSNKVPPGVEFVLDWRTGVVEVGLGGEWWLGRFSANSKKTVLHHKKERIDPAYAPVDVEVSDGRDGGMGIQFVVSGGFLSDPSVINVTAGE